MRLLWLVAFTATICYTEITLGGAHFTEIGKSSKNDSPSKSKGNGQQSNGEKVSQVVDRLKDFFGGRLQNNDRTSNEPSSTVVKSSANANVQRSNNNGGSPSGSKSSLDGDKIKQGVDTLKGIFGGVGLKDVDRTSSKPSSTVEKSIANANGQRSNNNGGSPSGSKSSSVGDKIKTVVEKLKDMFNTSNIKSSIEDLQKKLGVVCKDITVENNGSKPIIQTVSSGCKKHHSITVTSELPGNKCTSKCCLSQDKGNVIAQPGARLQARACVYEDEASQLKSLGSGNLNCTAPYISADGKCLLFATDTKGTQAQCRDYCAQHGGILARVNNMDSIISTVHNTPCLQDKLFHIEGCNNISPAKADILLSDVKTKCGGSETAAKSFCNRLQQGRKTQKVQVEVHSDVLSKKSVCVGKEKPVVVDQTTKYNCICESVQLPGNSGDDIDNDDIDCTPFTRLNQVKEGVEEQSLTLYADAYSRGEVKPDATICKKPLSVQWRIVGTNKYITEDNTQGYVIDVTGVGGVFRCLDSKQKNGAKCPKVEIKICCPVNVDSCSKDSVRKNCEKQGKECQDTVFGPNCVKATTPRTGKEIPGQGTCYVNNIEYTTLQCCSVGDPHFTSFCGKRYDAQNPCGQALVIVSNNFKESEDFQPFTIFSHNERRKPTDKVTYTKGFTFKIAGRQYTFIKKNLLYVDHLVRPANSYEDENVKITKSACGKIILETPNCVKITFDGGDSLCVSVPDHYKNYTSGLCGTLECDSQQATSKGYFLPESNTVVDLNTFTQEYAIVSTPEAPCEDNTPSPQADVSPKDIAKYSGDNYCGKMNPDNNKGIISYFAPYISNSDCMKAVRHTLDTVFGDCVNDCALGGEENVNICDRLDDAIDRLIDGLKLQDNPKIGECRRRLRNESSCEIKCGPNEVYNPKRPKFCVRTIFDLFARNTCDNPAVDDGCECKDGYVSDDDDNCVPIKEAEKACSVNLGCGVKPVILKDGQTIVKKPCEQTVTCNNGKATTNELKVCSDNAECSKDGLTCTCNLGYQGDGHTCIQDLKCKEGYINYGLYCFKYVSQLMTHPEAAAYCGQDDATLAKYDLEEHRCLDSMYDNIRENLKKFDNAKTIRVTAPPGTKYTAPSGQVILGCKSTKKLNNCSEAGHRIDNDGKTLIVGNCPGNNEFHVTTACAKEVNCGKEDHKCWVAGNAYIATGKFDDKDRPPCSNTLPKLVFSNSNDAVGCVHTTINKDNKMMLVSNPNCDEKRPFICQYGNTGEPVKIEDTSFPSVKGTYEECKAACNIDGRDLAYRLSFASDPKNDKILRDMGGGYLYLGFRKETNDGKFQCDNEDAGKADLDIVSSQIEKANTNNFDCVGLNAKTRKPEYISCNGANYAACGPQKGGSTPVFTEPFPCIGNPSHVALVQKLQREGHSNIPCEKPLSIECTAKTRKGSPLVCGTHKVGTPSANLKCEINNITCVDNGDVDCSSCQLRFLCLKSINLCEDAKKRNETLCPGGQICVPAGKYYSCQCPLGYYFCKISQRCLKWLPSCTFGYGRGLSTFAGYELGLKNGCKYLFTGTYVPVASKDPSFKVYIKRKTSTSDVSGSSLVGVEIETTNVQISGCGGQDTQKAVITFDVNSNSYTINGRKMSKSYTVNNNYGIQFREGRFQCVFNSLGVSVTVDGEKLAVKVGESISKNLYGLCGQGDGSSYTLTNGSILNVNINNNNNNPIGAVRSIVKNPLKPITSLLQAASLEIVRQLLNDYHVTAPGSPGCGTPEPVEVTVGGECSNVPLMSMCDVFKNDSGPFFPILNKIGRDPQKAVDSCRIQACVTGDPGTSVCNVASQIDVDVCDRGFHFNWRAKDLCHKSCGLNEIFSHDTSHETASGENKVCKRSVDYQPYPGCMCAPGFSRLNGKCVNASQPSCSTERIPGLLPVALEVGETILGPGCTEIHTCALDQDGNGIIESQDYVLGPNTRCTGGVTPIVVCVNGYEKDKSGNCQPIKNTCPEGFIFAKEKCYWVSSDPVPWNQASADCREHNGDFIQVDGDDYDLLKTLFPLNHPSDCYFVGGRVTTEEPSSGNEEPSRSKQSPSRGNEKPSSGKEQSSGKNNKNDNTGNQGTKVHQCLGEEHREKAGAANYRCNENVLSKVKVNFTQIFGGGSKPVGNKPLGNLNLAVSLSGSQPEVSAVSSCKKCGFFCVLRNNTDDHVYTNPCSSSKYFDKNGYANPNSECSSCAKPKGVKCAPANNATGTRQGTCSFTNLGPKYDCPSRQCDEAIVSVLCPPNLDECALKIDDCDPSARCEDTNDGYRCVCDGENSRLVDGVCHETTTCEMSGSTNADANTSLLKGYHGLSGFFPYQCKFKFVGPCPESVDSLSQIHIPLLYVYVTIGYNEEGKREISFNGYFYADGNTAHWFINQDSLKAGYIHAGNNASQLTQTAVGSKISSVNVQTTAIDKDSLTFSHLSGYFIVTILYVGDSVKIQISLSSHYTDKYCDVCSRPPTGTPLTYDYNTDILNEISLQGHDRCKRQATNPPGNPGGTSIRPSGSENPSGPSGRPSGSEKPSGPSGRPSGSENPSGPSGRPSGSENPSGPSGRPSGSENPSGPSGRPSGSENPSGPSGRPSGSENPSGPYGRPSGSENPSGPSERPSGHENPSGPSGRPSGHENPSGPSGRPSGSENPSGPSGRPSGSENLSGPSGRPSGHENPSGPSGRPSGHENPSGPSARPSGSENPSGPSGRPSGSNDNPSDHENPNGPSGRPSGSHDNPSGPENPKGPSGRPSDSENPSGPSGRPSGHENPSGPSGRPSGHENPSGPSGRPSGSENPSGPSGRPSGSENPSEPSGRPSGSNDNPSGHENPSGPSGRPSGHENPSGPSGRPSGHENPSGPSGRPSGSETPSGPSGRPSGSNDNPSGHENPSGPSGRPSGHENPSGPSGRPSGSNDNPSGPENPSGPSGRPSGHENPSGPSGRPSGHENPSGPSGRPSVSENPSGPSGRPSGSNDNPSGHENPNGPSGRPSGSENPSGPSGRPSGHENPSGPSGRPSGHENPSGPSARPSGSYDNPSGPENPNGPSGRPSGSEYPSGPSGRPSGHENPSGPSGRPSGSNDNPSDHENPNGPSGRPSGSHDNPSGPENPKGPSGRPSDSENPSGPSGRPSGHENPSGPSGRPSGHENPSGPSGRPSGSENPRGPSGRPSGSENPSGPSGRPSGSNDNPSGHENPSGPSGRPSGHENPSGPSGRPSGHENPSGPSGRPSGSETPSGPSGRPSGSNDNPSGHENPSGPSGRPSGHENPSGPSGRPSGSNDNPSGPENPSGPSGRPSGHENPSGPSGRPSGHENPSGPSGRPSVSENPSGPSGRPSGSNDNPSGHENPNGPSGRPSGSENPSGPSGRPSGHENPSGPSGRPSGHENPSGPSARPSGSYDNPSGPENPNGPSGRPSGSEYPSGPSGRPSGPENPNGPSGRPSGSEYPRGPSGRPSGHENPSGPSGRPSGDENPSGPSGRPSGSNDNPSGHENPNGPSGRPSDSENPSGPSGRPSGHENPSGPSGRPSGHENPSGPSGRPSGSNDNPSGHENPNGPSGRPSGNENPSGPSGRPSDSENPSGPSGRPSGHENPSGPSGRPSGHENPSGPSGRPSGHENPSGPSARPSGSYDNPSGPENPNGPSGRPSGSENPSGPSGRPSGHENPSGPSGRPSGSHGNPSGPENPSEPSGRPSGHENPSEPSGRPSGHENPSGPSGRPSGHENPSGPSGRPSGDENPSGPSGRPSGSNDNPSGHENPSGPSGRPSGNENPSGPSGRPSGHENPSGPSGRPSDSENPSGPSGRPSGHENPSGPSGRPSGHENPSGPSGRPSGSNDNPSGHENPSGPSGRPSGNENPSGPSGRPSGNENPSGSSGRPSDSENPSGPSGRPSSHENPSGPSGRPSGHENPSGPSGRPSGHENPSGPSGRPSDSENPSGPSGRPSGHENPSGPSGRPSGHENPSGPSGRPSGSYDNPSGPENPNGPSGRPSGSENPSGPSGRPSGHENPSGPSGRPSGHENPSGPSGRPSGSYDNPSGSENPNGPSGRPSGPENPSGPSDRPSGSNGNPSGPENPQGPPSNPSGPPTGSPSSEGSCDPNVIGFCADLYHCLPFSAESCQAHLCTGSLDKCSYLKTLVIQTTVDVGKVKQLIENICEHTCEDNEDFDFVERLAQPTCANLNARAAQSGVSTKDYVFACVCKHGLVRSSTGCVPACDCGCKDEEGNYYPKNRQWRSKDCKTLYTCLGETKVKEDEAPCGANTECVITELGPDCVCQEGRYGIPSCPQGCVEGVESNDGSETVYNFTKCNGDTQIHRICNDGFLSNCDDCEDVDECKTGLHECNLAFQKCVNFIGGYRCDCHDGYEIKKGKCKDINECTKGTPIHNCSANQGCLNTDGGYECTCCAGFKLDSVTGACENDPAYGVVKAGSACCHKCPDSILCSEEKPYCYTSENNERTDYNSFRKMWERSCLSGDALRTDRYQQGTCASTSPPSTGTGGGSGQPKNCDDDRVCSGISPPSPSLASGRVCGPSNSPTPQSYSSYCAMVKAECKRAGGPANIAKISSIPATKGGCSKKPPSTGAEALAEPIFTPWGPYDQCQFKNGNCGEGTETSRRSALSRDGRATREAKPEELESTVLCFEGCEPSEDNPTPDCIDASRCDNDEPVCGSVGAGAAKTYPSKCALNVDACNKQQKPIMHKYGYCDPSDDGSKSKLCSTGPVWSIQVHDREESGVHCVGEPVRVGHCGNLLCEGGEGKQCCRATKWEQIRVDLKCTTTDEKAANLAPVRHLEKEDRKEHRHARI